MRTCSWFGSALSGEALRFFWEGGVSGFWDLGSRNGQWIFGKYLIWGRFVYDAWLKRRTYYPVTNRRVIVLQNGWSRKLVAAYLNSLPALQKKVPTPAPAHSASLLIHPFSPCSQAVSSSSRGRGGWGPWNAISVGDTPIFRDIENLDYVYRLVSDLREKSCSAKP